MLPTVQEALEELELASTMNPGAWIDHSINVANAAKLIASNCGELDADKAFVLGLLHDIGRRNGVMYTKHIIEGYDYVAAKGWDEVAKICLTHSFPIQDITLDIGKKDISAEQYIFIDEFLQSVEYDDYDKLIILCDALGDANGFCILERRFVDTTRRYGVFPFTIDRWNKTFEYKDYFEKRLNTSVYSILPGIENSIY